MLATLVRHSAWDVAQKPAFEHAVEPAFVHTKADEKKIKKAGGIIFSAHNAEAMSEAANYPPGVTGLCPKVNGSFSREEFDGAAIFIPSPWGFCGQHGEYSPPTCPGCEEARKDVQEIAGREAVAAADRQ